MLKFSFAANDSRVCVKRAAPPGSAWDFLAAALWWTSSEIISCYSATPADGHTASKQPACSASAVFLEIRAASSF